MRAGLAMGVVLGLLGAAVAVGPTLLARFALRDVKQRDLLGSAAGPSTKGKGHDTIVGPKNILLVGVDSRPEDGDSGGVRADSIIIAHIPAGLDRAYLISIPRDTEVTIPEFRNGARTFFGGTMKINTAFAEGGAGLTGDTARSKATELLALTIRDTFGLTFDAAAVVDFDGFRQVVRDLGGVDMYVDQETRSIHVGFDSKGQFRVPCYGTYQVPGGGEECNPVPGVTQAVYKQGSQHLDAHAALDFVRQRKTLPNGDYDRQRHQQQFIQAVIRQVLSRGTLTDPVKMTGILRTMGRAMTLHPGRYAAEDWLFALKGVSADDIIPVRTNQGQFHPSQTNPENESLDPVSLALLESVKTGTVTAFIDAHPGLRSVGPPATPAPN